MTALAEPLRALPVSGGRALPDLRDGLPAGDVAALAAALEHVDVAECRDADVLAVAVGWERLEAMAAAGKASALAELAGRAGVGADRVVDEWEAATSCTQALARRVVGRAVRLAAQPALAGALRRGDLDVRRVDAVLDTLPVGGDPRRWAGLVDAVLDDAKLLSTPALKRLTARLVLAAEPEQAATRCARARADRGVELQPVEDGMAILHAYLPAPAAVTAFTVIDALAGTSRAAGDDRTVDQRRADEFADLFARIAETGLLPDGRNLPVKHRRRAQIQVTVAATTLLGLDDLPGELAGYGPIPAELAREIAADGTWRRLLTDPATGALVERDSATYAPGMLVARGEATYAPGTHLAALVADRDVTCTYMGCGQPAWRCEIDHREPFDPSRPADEQTTAANLDARCKHHHDLKGAGGWTVRRVPGSGACEWTDPWGITFTRLAIPLVVTAAALARLHRGGHPPHEDPDPTGGGYPDEPPF